jgi:hypothetical protein
MSVLTAGAIYWEIKYDPDHAFMFNIDFPMHDEEIDDFICYKEFERKAYRYVLCGENRAFLFSNFNDSQKDEYRYLHDSLITINTKMIKPKWSQTILFITDDDTTKVRMKLKKGTKELSHDKLLSKYIN